MPTSAQIAAVEAMRVHGSQRKAAESLGISRTALIDRLKAMNLAVSKGSNGLLHAKRYQINISDGIVVVFSDAHFWPGIISTAHRALVAFLKNHQSKIRAIICNGDALDGAQISRHPPINWEDRPSLIQEVETVKERLGEIEQAAPKAIRVWTLGNHDGRFESRLAALAPQYANIHGMHLKDHFPHWEPSWSCWINDDVVIKHRYKGGVHATHNNTVASGKTIVTGTFTASR